MEHDQFLHYTLEEKVSISYMGMEHDYFDELEDTRKSLNLLYGYGTGNSQQRLVGNWLNLLYGYGTELFFTEKYD